MLPTIPIIMFHRMKPDIFVGDQAREDFHLLLLGQCEESLGLVHGLIRIAHIDTLIRVRIMPCTRGQISDMIYHIEETYLSRCISYLLCDGLAVFKFITINA